MGRTVRCAIFGCGYMGQKHARILSDMPNVEVAWVLGRAGPEVEKLAAQVGADGTTDVSSVLADPSVELVIVAVPTFLHKDLAIQALHAGKKVICEKPITLSVADADQMIEAAFQAALAAGYTDESPEISAARYLMIGHVLRFWPEYRVIARLTDDGTLGEPLSVEAERLSTAPKWASWFDDVELSGGMVTDLMIHDFDYANSLLGIPVTVKAWGLGKGSDDWKHVQAVIEYDGGGRALITGSHLMVDSYPFTSSIRVIGSKAVAEYRYVSGEEVVMASQAQTNSLYLYTGPDAVVPNAYLSPDEQQDAYICQLDYFLRCIRQNRPPKLGTPHQARLALAVALAVRQSLRSGQTVEIGGVLEGRS